MKESEEEEHRELEHKEQRGDMTEKIGQRNRREEREGGVERGEEIDQQKDFAALAVSRMRGEAQRKHTRQQPVITRQSCPQASGGIN